MEIASTFKSPEKHNSLCLCTISFSIDKEMNADVVCHSLRLCKQDPGQPLCHLYSPPKVSWFPTFFKTTDCGMSFKLELSSLKASTAHVLSRKWTFRAWTFLKNIYLNKRWITHISCVDHHPLGWGWVKVTGPNSPIPVWIREEE